METMAAKRAKRHYREMLQNGYQSFTWDLEALETPPADVFELDTPITLKTFKTLCNTLERFEVCHGSKCSYIRVW